jgi:hypothetical protein
MMGRGKGDELSASARSAAWSFRAKLIPNQCPDETEACALLRFATKKETPVGGDRGLWGSSLLSRQKFWSGGNQNGQGGSALTNNDASKPVGHSAGQEPQLHRFALVPGRLRARSQGGTRRTRLGLPHGHSMPGPSIFASNSLQFSEHSIPVTSPGAASVAQERLSATLNQRGGGTRTQA